MIRLLVGDCRAVLRSLPEASVDAVVTDPPYGLGAAPDPLVMLRAWLDEGHLEVRGRGVMGHEWDAFVPQPATWCEVFRVLKPGGYVLAFYGARTYDLGVLAMRIAGFEIRDLVAWLHGQGFPKSRSSLKPALEPVVLARKPPASLLPGIDACRIETVEGVATFAGRISEPHGTEFVMGGGEGRTTHGAGRWPANVCHDGSEDVLTLMPNDRGAASSVRGDEPSSPTNGRTMKLGLGRTASEKYDAKGSAARFFYCAKATPADRLGFDHPTIKPIRLIEWLCKLVTPPGGTILDPFAGTGTTGSAALAGGFGAILVERDPRYAAFIRQRLGLSAEMPGSGAWRLNSA